MAAVIFGVAVAILFSEIASKHLSGFSAGQCPSGCDFEQHEGACMNGHAKSAPPATTVLNAARTTRVRPVLHAAVKRVVTALS